MPEMRSAGIDVACWFKAKSLQLIFGAMVEEKFLGKPFDEVWNSYNSATAWIACQTFGCATSFSAMTRSPYFFIGS
jgi:hypothetical protein